MGQGQLRQKLVRPYFKNKPGMEMNTFNPSYSGGRSVRIIVQGWPGKKHETLYKKMN
jgi:hypothetical protein